MKLPRQYLRKHLPLFLVVLVSSWICYRVGYHDGYGTASREVAEATQEVLLQNCLGFNNTLDMMGKLERMDCSHFSGISAKE